MVMVIEGYREMKGRRGSTTQAGRRVTPFGVCTAVAGNRLQTRVRTRPFDFTTFQVSCDALSGR